MNKIDKELKEKQIKRDEKYKSYINNFDKLDFYKSRTIVEEISVLNKQIASLKKQKKGLKGGNN